MRTRSNMNRPTDNLIEIEGLFVQDGQRPIIEGIDLRVPVGSVTAVVGSSGAGKSTLLRSLAGELRIESGSLFVLGLNPRK